MLLYCKNTALPILRTLCEVRDVQSVTERSWACCIPAVPADLVFRLIKDVLVNGAFGITFSTVK